MLSRPTTEQILLDCCRELMTNVLPSLTDATAQVSVIMVETVLRNTAVRAAHTRTRSPPRPPEPHPSKQPWPPWPPRRATACTSTTWWRPTAGPATPCPPP